VPGRGHGDLLAGAPVPGPDDYSHFYSHAYLDAHLDPEPEPDEPGPVADDPAAVRAGVLGQRQ
jgi:hypothetical protein